MLTRPDARPQGLALAALIAVSAAAPALASSDDAWEAFRLEVEQACRAAVTGPGEVSVEVNPFGSQSYGAAIVIQTLEAGSDRMVCIFDKATKAVELTAPFPADGPTTAAVSGN